MWVLPQVTLRRAARLSLSSSVSSLSYVSFSSSDSSPSESSLALSSTDRGVAKKRA